MRTTFATLSMLALLVSACGSEEPQPGRPAEPAAVTIRHKFGTTEVPARPQRVVAVGFNDQDFALALGVVPMG